jgi:hypothetical protein
MRRAGKLLCWFSTAALGILGCHTQPNLKPDEKPEVLAVPAAEDKRYSEPAQYPASELASDSTKKGLNTPGITPVRGPKGGGPMMTGPGGGP